MTDFRLPIYHWRGRTYKTVLGLCRAVDRIYPNRGVSFGEFEMHVRLADDTLLIFDVAREEGLSTICDEPKATRQ